VGLRLEVFHRRCLRSILGVSRRDGISIEELLRRTQLCNIGTTIRRLRLRWLGHVMRMPGERVARQVLFGQLRGTRPVGSPPVTLRGLMRNDVLLLNGGGGQVHGRRLYQQCFQPLTASQHVWWPAMLPLAHARYFTGWPQCYCQGGLGTSLGRRRFWCLALGTALEHGMQFGAYASYQVTRGAHGLLLLCTSSGTVGCMASAYCGSRPCRHCPSPCNALWLL
jgi:hypothetical protein